MPISKLKSPFQVVEDFEAALCEYTGAKYAVAVNSCTMALFLSMMRVGVKGQKVYIPHKTYISVPMQIMHAGGEVAFRPWDWKGAYELSPFGIWDSARWFTKDLFRLLHSPNRDNRYVCVSFHISKTLGLDQGGAILHNDDEAHESKWFERARFDGRMPGVPAAQDTYLERGWHCYMSPSIAALGLLKLYSLPEANQPLNNDDYPDLSQLELFKNAD